MIIFHFQLPPNKHHTLADVWQWMDLGHKGAPSQVLIFRRTYKQIWCSVVNSELNLRLNMNQENLQAVQRA